MRQSCKHASTILLLLVVHFLAVCTHAFHSLSALRCPLITRVSNAPSSSWPSTDTETRPERETMTKPASSHPSQAPDPPPKRQPWRRLGSFETLLARKAAAGPQRLSIPHVCVAVVDDAQGLLTPQLLKPALVSLVRRHPKLRACIQGTGKVEGAPVAGVRRGGKEVDPLMWWPCAMTPAEVVEEALSFDDSSSSSSMNDDEQDRSFFFSTPFQAALDKTDMDSSRGPLWRLHVLRSQGSRKGTKSTRPGEGGQVALLFIFNHAMSDQASCNTLIHELLSTLGQTSSFSSSSSSIASQPFPPSIEKAILGSTRATVSLTTALYAAREGLFGLLPTTLHPTATTTAAAAATALDVIPPSLPAANRRTICVFRREELLRFSLLKEECKKRGVTVTAALSAAMLYATSDLAHGEEEDGREEGVREGERHNYRFLLSLNMRAFSRRKLGQVMEGGEEENEKEKEKEKEEEEEEDWVENAVASAAGAMDFMVRMQEKQGRNLLFSHKSTTNKNENAAALAPSAATAPAAKAAKAAGEDAFWLLAKQCRREFLDFVSAGFVPESVNLFDWGMQTLELNEVVEKEAENPKTLGRAYTCGVSNMGVFEGGTGGRSSRSSSSSSNCGSNDSSGVGRDSSPPSLSSFSSLSSYGPLRLHGIHYATSHSLTGSLYQLSCGTVNGALCLTFHYPWPLVDRETAERFADRVVQILRRISGGER